MRIKKQIKAIHDKIVIDVDEVIRCDETGSYALIVGYPSGLLYTSQCDGGICSHPEYEGFVVRVSNIYRVVDDCVEGCSALSSDGYDDDKEGDEFRESARLCRIELAKEIDKKLLNVNNGRMRFDFSRVDEFREGWWPVLFRASPNGFRYGCYSAQEDKEVEYKCILCGWNCD
ncbi:MAG TPA: DUF6210 family protein [Nitrososphaeraceae archaeon]